MGFSRDRYPVTCRACNVGCAPPSCVRGRRGRLTHRACAPGAQSDTRISHSNKKHNSHERRRKELCSQHGPEHGVAEARGRHRRHSPSPAHPPRPCCSPRPAPSFPPAAAAAAAARRARHLPLHPRRHRGLPRPRRHAYPSPPMGAGVHGWFGRWRVRREQRGRERSCWREAWHARTLRLGVRQRRQGRCRRAAWRRRGGQGGAVSVVRRLTTLWASAATHLLPSTSSPREHG